MLQQQQALSPGWWLNWPRPAKASAAPSSPPLHHLTPPNPSSKPSPAQPNLGTHSPRSTARSLWSLGASPSSPAEVMFSSASAISGREASACHDPPVLKVLVLEPARKAEYTTLRAERGCEGENDQRRGFQKTLLHFLSFVVELLGRAHGQVV